jgi:hypothetical protein
MPGGRRLSCFTERRQLVFISKLRRAFHTSKHGLVGIVCPILPTYPLHQ